MAVFETSLAANLLRFPASLSSQIWSEPLTGCGKIRFCWHIELARGVFSNANRDEEWAYSDAGTSDRAIFEGWLPFLDLLAPCRDTTPHTFPAGIAVARFRMRTRL